MSADRVRPAARALLDAHPRVVLAVSGGLDSMTLLDAVAAERRGERIIAATFDHGTGADSAGAARLVARAARERGMELRRGRASLAGASEAEWRDARWRFLRTVAREVDALVATAHTRDDQIETVAFRVMRGTGARGLAGLYAASDVVRPFIDLTRREIETYAATGGVAHVEDPSNASLRHARNRLRHELLPALRCVAPALDEELLDIARRAAGWRSETEALASGFVRSESRDAGALAVDREALAALEPDALAILWPAIASRVGVTLDRRGTERLVSFTITGRPGRRIQLSGRVEACRASGEIRLTRRAAGLAPAAGPRRANLGGPLTLFGAWRFVRLGVDTEIEDSVGGDGHSGRVAALPADATLEVRAWRPGDRMTLRRAPGARRVKRYLVEAGLTVSERDGWPVVVADGEIVWIPGICRSDAATARSGRPVVRYACERFVR